MVFAVYDMDTKEIVKDFTINKKDDIYFKNTTFIESRDGKKKFKDTYSTANFFKKVINSNSALSVRKVDDNYLISIGASEKVSNSFPLAIIGGVLGGAPGAALLSAFESYDSTKSLKTDSFFDKEFNYFKREQPVNKFDLIYEYKRNNQLKNVPNQTIFEYGNFYVWGFYNRATGLYRYMKF